MKRLSTWSLLALVIAFAGCVSPHTILPPDNAVEQARQSLARGVTMPDMFDRSDAALWVTYQQLDVFRELRKVGFDAVRIPVDLTRAQRQSTAADAELSDIWLTRVERMTRQALRAKLAVVITARREVNLSDPTAQRQLIADWSQLAWHLRKLDDRVYFELLESPDGDLTDAAWSRLAEEIRLAIRLSNPGRILIIGPAQHYNVTRLLHLDLPPDPNLLFAFSYNEPLAFTRQDDGVRWSGTDEEVHRIKDDLNSAAQWAREHNRKLFCASFGATSRADPESRMRWTDFIARALEERNIAWSYRDFTGPDGIFDREWNIWRQPLVNTLLDK